MRTITKMMLTAALLIAGVGGVKARTNIDMSTTTAGENASWNSGTSTFSWTAENAYIVIPGLSGDLTGCYLDFTISAECHIDIVDTENHVMNGGWNGYGRFGSGGSKTQDLGFMVSGSDCDITKVKEVRICSQSASGNLTVTNVSYYYPVIPQFNSDGVATVNLKSLVASGGLSFDPSTGVVTCNGTSGNLSLEFFNSVNLTGLIRYDVSISGSDNIMWRSIVKSQSTDVLAYYSSKWGGNLTSAERSKAIAVNEFYWESKSTEEISNIEEANRTFTITSITLTAEKMNVINAHDVPIASLPHYSVANDGTVSLGSPISTNYGSASEQPLGDGSSKMDEYIDIADYDELRIYTSDNARVFFVNAETITSETNDTDGATAYLTNNNSPFLHNETDGYYYITVSAIKEKYKGHAKVIGVKGPAYQATATITKIQVYKANPSYDYILSGQYSSAVDISSVTSDAKATVIDCSGLSGNGATITSANPNCLFVASEGVLSNPNNVIVSGACAQLALSDGYPFKSPVAFTATAAPIYDRTFTTGAPTTVCLPFALTSAEAATLGKFYVLDSFNGSTLHFTSVSEPAANTPYLVVPTATDLTLSETGKSIAATPAELGASITNVDFIGTLAATQIPASDDENSYFAYNNGSMVKIVTKPATLPAFRGYFKIKNSGISSGSGSVRSLNISLDDESAGIKTIGSSQLMIDHRVYDLQGRRVSQPTKGLYIVNGKKVIK